MPLLKPYSATMPDAWINPSQKKDKSKKKTPGNFTQKNNVTDPSLASLPPQNYQPVPQGSTDNFHNTPTNIRKPNQISYQLKSPTNESNLTSTEENIPAYFNHFMKAINDQISQIHQ